MEWESQILSHPSGNDIFLKGKVKVCSVMEPGLCCLYRILDQFSVIKSGTHGDVSGFVVLNIFALKLIINIESVLLRESVVIPPSCPSFENVIDIVAFEDELPVL